MAEQKKYTQEEIMEIMGRDSSEEMIPVSKFRLKSFGGFVVKMEFAYLDDNGNRQVKHGTGKNIFYGNSDEYGISQAGVPKGAICTVYPNILGGEADDGPFIFINDPDVRKIANFTINGATRTNSTEYVGLTDY